jgi:glycosyltransferase involved in cell wall biosynthesis
MPQIFYRDILQQSVEFFAPFLAEAGSLPEWETYGNFALGRFPERFQAPRPFTVLGWPDKPHWPWYVVPAQFDFENYYPSAYEKDGPFFGLSPNYDPAKHAEVTAEKIRRYSDFFARFWAEKRRRSRPGWRIHRLLPKAVRDFYRARRDRRPRLVAGVPPAPSPGKALPTPYSVAGLFTLPTGLGHAASLLHRTLKASFPGETVERIDISSFFASGRHPPPPEALLDRRGETIVVCLNPPQGARLLRRLPRSIRRQNRLVGYWWWEFPSFPESWRPFVGSFDEVWVSSRFLEEAWKRELAIPVRWVPLDLREADAGEGPDDGASRASAPMRMLSILNLGSTLGRKNIAAAVAVLRQLRATGADVWLTIKLGGVTAYPDRYLEFLKLHTVGEGIDVIVGNFSDADIARLIDRHDIYISMHRAEGLGISLAQSMWRRKVVVASRWSGNLDYMTDASSILIDCVPAKMVDENGNATEPLICAEPSVDYAVARISEIIADRQRMAEMGRLARLRIDEVSQNAVAHNARNLRRNF